jgi:hypothetical protein
VQSYALDLGIHTMHTQYSWPALVPQQQRVVPPTQVMLGACQGSGLSDDDFDVTAGEHLGRVPVCRTATVRVLDDDAEGTSDAETCLCICRMSCICTDGRAASGATAASVVSSLGGKRRSNKRSLVSTIGGSRGSIRRQRCELMAMEPSVL